MPSGSVFIHWDSVEAVAALGWEGIPDRRCDLDLHWGCYTLD